MTARRVAVAVLGPQEGVAVGWHQGHELLMLAAASGQSCRSQLLPERHDVIGTWRAPWGVQERRRPPDLHHGTLSLHIGAGTGQRPSGELWPDYGCPTGFLWHTASSI
jgi:hypothetical protein